MFLAQKTGLPAILSQKKWLCPPIAFRNQISSTITLQNFTSERSEISLFFFFCLELFFLTVIEIRPHLQACYNNNRSVFFQMTHNCASVYFRFTQKIHLHIAFPMWGRWKKNREKKKKSKKTLQNAGKKTLVIEGARWLKGHRDDGKVDRLLSIMMEMCPWQGTRRILGIFFPPSLSLSLL